ncbi:MAG: helix-turn-helix transcriptional regulator, partial [Dermatophilaceae bacterium]
IRDASRTAPDSETFRQEVLDALHAYVPFDASCLGGTDPYALVPTSLTIRGYDDLRAYAVAVEVEYGEVDEPGSFESMVRGRIPVRTLRETTEDRPRTTRRYAELLAPYGLDEEIRMVMRGTDGLVWGVATVSRRGERRFDDHEEAMVGSVLTEIGDGLRTMLFRDATTDLAGASEVPDGPAFAVLGPGNEFEMVTPAALAHLERLAWGPAGSPVGLAPAAMAAARLRASDQESIVLRSRTRDGEWLVIRAGPFDANHPPRRVVMTVERARPPEIVSLMAAAYGLTRRECQVLLLSLRGETRDEMARTLFISPYTVQDHLKSIFAKAGVNSRRGLVARLVNTEYMPRIASGTPVGPDGWFADAQGR